MELSLYFVLQRSRLLLKNRYTVFTAVQDKVRVVEWAWHLHHLEHSRHRACSSLHHQTHRRSGPSVPSTPLQEEKVPGASLVGVGRVWTVRTVRQSPGCCPSSLNPSARVA